jgi:hypothetical protein
MSWKGQSYRQARPIGFGANAGLLGAATLAGNLAERSGHGAEARGTALAFRVIASACLGVALAGMVLHTFPELKRLVFGPDRSRD